MVIQLTKSVRNWQIRSHAVLLIPAPLPAPISSPVERSHLLAPWHISILSVFDTHAYPAHAMPGLFVHIDCTTHDLHTVLIVLEDCITEEVDRLACSPGFRVSRWEFVYVNEVGRGVADIGRGEVPVI